MSERKKVLWLVSWYPNRYDPFDGDFIQRHARAAAMYDDITVLFIKQAAEQPVLERVQYSDGHLTEQLIYLPKKSGFPGKFSNIFWWWTIFRKEAALLVQQQQTQVVHAHVPWKAGLMALWLKRKYSLPFLVTEHWGIYNSVVDDNIHTRSALFRRLLRRIYNGAKAFVTVSRFLGEGVNKTLLPKEYVVIPNVVDTAIFHPAPIKASRFTFLHVSNMVPLKNVEGILLAFQQFLEKTRSEAQLVLVGNRDDHYRMLAAKMNLLNKSVFFRGEIPYNEVAKTMQQVHVLVLNSDMENSPCVIGEALCCGLPVIATKVGGIPELLTPENSIIVSPRDTEALAVAYYQIEKNFGQYNPEKIAAAAQQTFSMRAVGQRLHDLYGG